MGGVVAGSAVGEPWFELSFVGPDGDRRREPLRRCWRVGFEEVPPVRPFHWAKGGRSFAGWYYAVTVGDHVGFESWLERDHVMLLDFDPMVTAVASQPFWLHWHDGERERRHAPDFFVRHLDGSGMVLDVRPDDGIETRDAEVFEATGLACEAVGWAFRRVGTPDPVFLANVRWLSRYRHPRCGYPSETVARLLDVFACPTGLFAGAGQVGERISVLPVLFHLMWRQILVSDLAQELLGTGSVVHVAGDGLR